MYLYTFLVVHGGSSGKVLPYYLESTFEDFKAIMEIVIYYLTYKLHFFGLDMSIMSVMIGVYILFVSILFVTGIFGKGD